MSVDIQTNAELTNQENILMKERTVDIIKLLHLSSLAGSKFEISEQTIKKVDPKIVIAAALSQGFCVEEFFTNPFFDYASSASLRAYDIVSNILDKKDETEKRKEFNQVVSSEGFIKRLSDESFNAIVFNLAKKGYFTLLKDFLSYSHVDNRITGDTAEKIVINGKDISEQATQQLLAADGFKKAFKTYINKVQNTETFYHVLTAVNPALLTEYESSVPQSIENTITKTICLTPKRLYDEFSGNKNAHYIKLLASNPKVKDIITKIKKALQSENTDKDYAFLKKPILTFVKDLNGEAVKAFFRDPNGKVLKDEITTQVLSKISEAMKIENLKANGYNTKKDINDLFNKISHEFLMLLREKSNTIQETLAWSLKQEVDSSTVLISYIKANKKALFEMAISEKQVVESVYSPGRLIYEAAKAQQYQMLKDIGNIPSLSGENLTGHKLESFRHEFNQALSLAIKTKDDKLVAILSLNLQIDKFISTETGGLLLDNYYCQFVTSDISNTLRKSEIQAKEEKIKQYDEKCEQPSNPKYVAINEYLDQLSHLNDRVKFDKAFAESIADKEFATSGISEVVSQIMPNLDDYDLDDVLADYYCHFKGSDHVKAAIENTKTPHEVVRLPTLDRECAKSPSLKDMEEARSGQITELVSFVHPCKTFEQLKTTQSNEQQYSNNNHFVYYKPSWVDSYIYGDTAFHAIALIYHGNQCYKVVNMAVGQFRQAFLHDQPAQINLVNDPGDAPHHPGLAPVQPVLKVNEKGYAYVADRRAHEAAVKVWDTDMENYRAELAQYQLDKQSHIDGTMAYSAYINELSAENSKAQNAGNIMKAFIPTSCISAGAHGIKAASNIYGLISENIPTLSIVISAVAAVGSCALAVIVKTPLEIGTCIGSLGFTGGIFYADYNEHTPLNKPIEAKLAHDEM